MSTNEEVLAAIDAAFMEAPKPEHFMEYVGDPECTEHDELLRTRDRETLTIEDVGNVGYEPISYCSPQGMAYYMPALARLSLAEPTYRNARYGDSLLIDLSKRAKSNEFLKFCSKEQRLAVAMLLRHLSTMFPGCDVSLSEPWEFIECAEMWGAI